MSRSSGNGPLLPKLVWQLSDVQRTISDAGSNRNHRPDASELRNVDPAEAFRLASTEGDILTPGEMLETGIAE